MGATVCVHVCLLLTATVLCLYDRGEFYMSPPDQEAGLCLLGTLC